MAETLPDGLETPFFLLDEQTLLDEVTAVRSALQRYWNNFTVAYSVKTNSLPGLAVVLRQAGLCAEVVSEDEYEMISHLGYKPRQIICNGPVKRERWVKELLDNGALLNIDSHRELTYVSAHALGHPDRTFAVGLRINLDIERFFPGESTGGLQGSRFGFSRGNGDLQRAVGILKSCPNVHIAGLHLHVSTRSRSPQIYRWLVKEFASIAAEHDLLHLHYLDIGGGFYGGLPDKPSWNEYIGGISEELTRLGYSPERLTLVLEPGVSLLAGCFSYYTSIIDVKQTARHTCAVCDGSRIHIDPLMHKSDYFYQIEFNGTAPRTDLPVQQLAGFTCLENDCFFNLYHRPELSEGDRIRFDRVGAYTLTLSPLFISYFPAVYLRRSNGGFACIREKWRAREFLQLSHTELE